MMKKFPQNHKTSIVFHKPSINIHISDYVFHNISINFEFLPIIFLKIGRVKLESIPLTVRQKSERNMEEQSHEVVNVRALAVRTHSHRIDSSHGVAQFFENVEIVAQLMMAQLLSEN